MKLISFLVDLTPTNRIAQDYLLILFRYVFSNSFSLCGYLGSYT
jgi:hypothetical protein